MIGQIGKYLILWTVLLAVLGCGKKSRQWKSHLQQPSLSSGEFTHHVASAIRETIPKAKVKLIQPLELDVETDVGTATCRLDNAWKECRDTPAIRVDVVHRYVDALKSSLATSSRITINDVVPIIKGQRWLDQTASQEMEIYREPLTADMFVVYAVDGPSQLAYVNQEQFESIELDTETFRATAIKNLADRLPEVSRLGEGPLYMLAAGGTFEASLLLLSEVWDSQEKAVDGRVVVAVPTRDLLLFTGEDAPEAIQQMRDKVEQAYETNNYRISRKILIRDGNGWRAFDEVVSE